jgi:hypothetical protein
MATKKTNHQSKNNLKTLVTDDEIARLRLRLNKKRDYIAILELELFNTRAALYKYQQLFNQNILPLERRLRYLRSLLYKALEAQRGNGNNEQPDYGEPEEPEFTYQDFDENGWQKVAKHVKKAKSPHLEEKIRKLFRELAKRFHPDLTSNEKEKEWRAQIMTQVNMAYAQRDLKALQALADQPDHPSSTVAQSHQDEVNMLKSELVRLDGVIAELKASIRHLEESPAMKLMMESRLQRRNGKDLLTGMVNQLQEQIADLEEHLIVLGVEIANEEAESP